MKAILFSSIFLFFFLYYYIVKKKSGIEVIIFSIPFSYTPFFSVFIGEILPVSITGILVILCYLLSYTKIYRQPNNIKFLYFKRALYVYLLFGIFFSFVYYDEARTLSYQIGYLPTQIGKLSEISQVVYNSANILICILFIDILKWHLRSKNIILSTIRTFSFTIVPIFIYQLIQMTGNSNILGGIFVPALEFDTYDVRYLSFFTTFGIGIYIAMVVAFSLYFRFKYYLLTFVFGLLYALFTGERQAIVMPFIVLLVYIIFTPGSNGLKILRIVSFFTISYVLVFVLKDHVYGISRLWLSINMTTNNEILEASGRDVQGIPYIIDKLKAWPLFGKGLYNWGYFAGVRSYYADHVVLFNIYQKFGIIGFVFFVFASILILLRYLKKSVEFNYLKLNGMIVSLIICYIGMQFLDNFFWFTNTMLLYIYLFSLIFSLEEQSFKVYYKIIKD